MKKFRFRNFQVYKDVIKFRGEIKFIVEKYFPEKERYLLTDQLIRAANSILLNIAEGSDRSTDKDFALLLNRSHTSLCEVVSCLDIALSDNYINREIHSNYVLKAEDLANQLTAFRKKLITFPNK